MNKHQQTILPDPHSGALVAADVGGTHARLAVVVPAGDGEPGFSIQHYEKFACADFDSLASIFLAFRERIAPKSIGTIALAIAGYIVDDAVIYANLPWPVSIAELRSTLGVRELAITNDFEAVAHAVGRVDARNAFLLSGPAAVQQGPVLVVGPGTGLGAAVRVPHRDGAIILATEAGQATLAAETDFEIEIVRELRGQGPRVLVEHVLSGTGLKNLDAAVRRLRGFPPLVRTPAQITAAARAGSDPAAVEAVDVFCAWFGSVLGDFALLYGAKGGIYLAGGVLPQMRDLLVRSRFVERFLDKGAMREALVRTSVRLIDHAELGVIGAASWYFEREPDLPRVERINAPTRNGVTATMDPEEPGSEARLRVPVAHNMRGERS